MNECLTNNTPLACRARGRLDHTGIELVRGDVNGNKESKAEDYASYELFVRHIKQSQNNKHCTWNAVKMTRRHLHPLISPLDRLTLGLPHIRELLNYPSRHLVCHGIHSQLRLCLTF